MYYYEFNQKIEIYKKMIENRKKEVSSFEIYDIVDEMYENDENDEIPIEMSKFDVYLRIERNLL